MSFIDEIDDSQKGICIYLIGLADFFYRIITETQWKSETTHDLQQVVIVANQVTHFIG
jgi:hypothetical protein